MIRIKSKQAGFRRCGVAHPADWTEYPDDRFGKEEMKVLRAEPMLSVEIVADASGDQAPATDESKAAAPAKAGKKGKK